MKIIKRKIIENDRPIINTFNILRTTVLTFLLTRLTVRLQSLVSKLNLKLYDIDRYK